MPRRLGQHFLRDPAILDRIVDALDPRPDDIVLEIGPGEGTLTRRLAPRVGRVLAIEKDRHLVDKLGGVGSGSGSLRCPAT
jgi:16S rRNA (adenine1518-N6/adenine1519-N6)-dimethyltransferase